MTEKNNVLCESITHVYVCGFYKSDNQRERHIIKTYVNEKDALNKMIQLCKTDENDGGYLWLFDEININNIDSVTTYQEFNNFIMNNCKHYYDDWVYYLYIEKVELK
jgi:hypothetical protein